MAEGFAINPPNAPIGRVGDIPVIIDRTWYRYFAQVQQVTGSGLITTLRDAQYLTYAANPALPNSRVFLAGTALTLTMTSTDATIDVDVNGITNALFRQSAGLSVVGRASDTTGNVADIVAATDGQVLRRSGITIGFGAVDLASVNAVTGALGTGNGGTGGSTPSGTLLDNITGFAGTGMLARTGAGTYAFRTDTGTANRITVTNGNGVAGNPTFDIAATYVGQATITTLGTIGTGVWNGTAVTVPFGGTGVATLTANALVRGNGASPVLASVINDDGTDTAVGLAVVSGVRMMVRGTTTAAGAYTLFARNSANADLFLVRNDGLINTGLAAASPYNNTTASAANLVVDVNGSFLRSTSSARYKTDIQPLDLERTRAVIMGLKPMAYRSTASADNPEWTYYGFAAEDVEKVEKRFVHYGYSEKSRCKDGRPRKNAKMNIPDGVQYERVVVAQNLIIQDLVRRVEALEAKVTALP